MAPVFVGIFLDIGADDGIAVQAQIGIDLCNADDTHHHFVFQTDVSGFRRLSPGNFCFYPFTAALRAYPTLTSLHFSSASPALNPEFFFVTGVRDKSRYASE